MDYTSVISYLYHAAPMFSNIGAGAYKEGLSTTLALDEHFGHPHRRYHTIHVAGTNGKGSVSSTLAAILQSAGLRVGLYTSPHLVDFRERIRVDGEMISEQRVIDFVEQERAFFEPLCPSFFELTTALAFKYFSEQEVDVAVVEVGLGGRLDCTNIITPDLAVITNISFDHQQFLGDTLPQIAAEKAGIIKKGIPVVIGETNGHADVRDVFLRTFKTVNSKHSFAATMPDESLKAPAYSRIPRNDNATAIGDSIAESLCPSLRFADEKTFAPIPFQLKGEYQHANLQTVLCALSELRKQPYYAESLTDETIAYGAAHVMELTGLRGRWQQLCEQPVMVCDAGHNEAGITFVAHQLQSELERLRQEGNGRMRIVFGMVGDKDYRRAAQLLGTLQGDVVYYLTQPSCARALDKEVLAAEFAAFGCDCACYASVMEAVKAARTDASPKDFIFVGGSCYVVADLLAGMEEQKPKYS